MSEPYPRASHHEPSSHPLVSSGGPSSELHEQDRYDDIITDGDVAGVGEHLSELQRLAGVMQRLRADCPWDAKQTHRSLVTHLIEETAEVVDAVEADPIQDTDLREELGDLLMQVYFHAEIARRDGRFDIEDVARGICDKLVARHPWVFSQADDPDDLAGTWEQAKQAEKKRTSALEGIPESLNTLARAGKVVSRSRAMQVPVELASEPITADAGREILAIVQRAQASGVDADQATRDALRVLENQVRENELHSRASGS